MLTTYIRLHHELTRQARSERLQFAAVVWGAVLYGVSLPVGVYLGTLIQVCLGD